MNDTITHIRTGVTLAQIIGDTLADKVERLNDYMANPSTLTNSTVRAFVESHGPFVVSDFKLGS